MHASSEPVVDTPESPNDISISDAELNDNVNDNVHVDAQPSKNNDVEIEPAVDLDNPQSKNQRYDKRDFVLGSTVKKENHGFKNPCPSPKPSKSKDDEDFERFAEMIRPIFLRMHLTDILKMAPYAK